MDGYGQFCPVSLAAEVFARRWTPLIIRELLCGSTHFSDLRRGIPNISASVLSRRLDELEVAGIVERRERKGGVHYFLTAAGQELRPAVEALGVWGRRWLPAEHRERDLDSRLLVWDIHRNINLDRVGTRTLIELHFSDGPARYRAYWLLVDPAGAEVCLTHPGGDVDVRIGTDVRTLTDVWMGNLPWAAACRSGRLRLSGDAGLCDALPGWLRLSSFAGIEPLRVARR